MQSVHTTTKPHIPDHEVLHVIGRGAYGEIWMARSLTGALRAVKVVHRSTFASERAFQREFDGMSSFEPISRAHDGFVDILHVGRTEAFFYYIMELADDSLGGRAIEPQHYTPRTLRSDLEARQRLPVSECVEVGLGITHALCELHRHRLSHRDVKPENIIFIDSVPKLADIGLVAVSGQRSFVGTEGYVPPEGPGTPAADVYSLGKVLYEISMGKDRFQFPEVRTALTGSDDGLMQLNEVLLKACANDVAKRYPTADAMRDDLLRLQRGQRARQQRRWLWPVAAVLLLLVVGAGVLRWRQTQTPSAPVVNSTVSIVTEPAGAMVLLGDRVRTSPARFEEVEPGRYKLRVMLAGHEAVETRVEVEGDLQLPVIALPRSKGGLRVESEQPGTAFELRQNGQQAVTGTAPATFEELPTGTYQLVATQNGRELHLPVEIVCGEVAQTRIAFAPGAVAVTSEPEGAEIVVDGQTHGRTPARLELLPGEHEITGRYDGWPEQHLRVRVEAGKEAAAAFRFATGRVKITSAPGGAAVFDGERELGRTPLLIEELKPGPVSYEVRLGGYRAETVSGTIEPDRQVFLAARLEKRQSPEPDQPWTNSLGMVFVPVGQVRFSQWETRVRDYEAFCAETGRATSSPDFAQTPDHPVVKVSWRDAEAFCEWLTEKERNANLLEQTQRYRLPTDAEWSAAAGLPNEEGRTPEERDGKVKDFFPWGKAWPPPPNAGNFADALTRRTRGAGGEQLDVFSHTAPVGSFAPNESGLHDLAGNVWEWCAEGYRPGGGRFKDWGVLRGGSWANANRSELQTSYRNVVDRDDRDVLYGFRCVLETEP